MQCSVEKALKAYAPSGEVDGKLLFAEHHQSHAASAFFPSPFEEAVVLTMDGVGEWATTSVAIGRGNTHSSAKCLKNLYLPVNLTHGLFKFCIVSQINKVTH